MSVGDLVAQIVKNSPAMQRPRSDSWVRKMPWRRYRLPTSVFMGFPGGSAGKESACNAGDLGLIPGLGRSLGGGNGNPLQYSCLKNPQGQRSLVGYSPWDCKESDMTEHLSTAQHMKQNNDNSPKKTHLQHRHCLPLPQRQEHLSQWDGQQENCFKCLKSVCRSGSNS